jgi:hypothetical protein
MSDVIITEVGAIWLAGMVARIGSVGVAVAHGGNTGDDTATSGGAYSGAVDQVYTIVITKAGAAGVAEITVTGSAGDNSGPTIVTGEDTAISIGNLGATVSFDFGADNLLELGDQYTIACEGIDDIKHCAIGSGDGTFTDPENPPEEDVDATALKGEFARVAVSRKSYLVEDEFGAITVGNVNYSYSDVPTNIVLYEFQFAVSQGEAATIKELGLFADDAALRVAGAYGENGLYDAGTNPTGEVSVLGTLYGVKNIPDYVLKNTEPGQHKLNIRYLLRTRGGSVT